MGGGNISNRVRRKGLQLKIDDDRENIKIFETNEA